MESNTATYCLMIVLIAQAIVANAAVKRTQLDKFTVTVPPECLGAELCNVKPVDWPTERMDRIASQMNKRMHRQAPSSAPVSVHHSENNDNCVEKTKQVKPYVVLIHNDTQRLVVQSKTYEQTISAVTCSKEKAPCLTSVSKHAPYKLRFCCESQYSLVRLKTWNFELNIQEIYEARVPSGCTCMKMNNISDETTMHTEVLQKV